MSKKYTELDIDCKKYESLTESVLIPGLPVLVRVDGRAFHTFTTNIPKPYCVELSNLMINTTKYLIEQTNALTGYVQSDEISLLLYNDNTDAELLFGGRVQKLTSVIASMAAAYFNKEMKALNCYFYAYKPVYPCFDCRVWQVPNKEKALSYFIWRERDAIKNSISMLAQSKFSHKQLQNKNCSEMQEMLWQKHNINWNREPPHFKRGTFCKTVQYKTKFTQAEIENLPEKHEARKNKDLTFVRNIVSFIYMEDLSKKLHPIDFLFNKYFTY